MQRRVGRRHTNKLLETLCKRYYARSSVCCDMQASGTLPAGSMVSALVIGDLGAMPVPSVGPTTKLPSS